MKITTVKEAVSAWESSIKLIQKGNSSGVVCMITIDAELGASQFINLLARFGYTIADSNVRKYIENSIRCYSVTLQSPGVTFVATTKLKTKIVHGNPNS